MGNCPFGLICKFECIRAGACRRFHDEGQCAHFEEKRAGLERERGAACPFFLMGSCRWGKRCRRTHSAGPVDSNHGSSSDEDAVVRSSSSSSAGDGVGLVAKMRDRLPRPLPKPRLDPRGIDDVEDLGYLSEEVGVGGPGSSNGSEGSG